MNQPNSHRAEDQEPSGVDPGAQRDHGTPPGPERPRVGSAEAEVFGRPKGVTGGFDTARVPGAGRTDGSDRTADDAAASGTLSSAPPPPESLVEAFGPPAVPGSGSGLQRPAESPREEDDNGGPEPLWGSTEEPWRDPTAGATLGGPAVSSPEREGKEPRGRSVGAMLSLPEVLFGRRVKPTALGLLGVVALLIGACGGLVGWGAANWSESLTGELNIARADVNTDGSASPIAEIVEQVAPAVVSVQVTVGNRGGLGSGVVIDPKGYILTNYHVISLAERKKKAEITVVFIDGTRVPATIVGSDPKTDLAVLDVDVPDPVVIEIGNSSELEPGDRVIAIGSPFGLANTVTAGIVSAVHRPVTAPGVHGAPPVTFDAIQTDAPINPGNSGGALVDYSGALVGINSLIRTVGNVKGKGGSIGIGFAIPIDHAIKIARKLIEQGYVNHPQIGVNAASVSSQRAAGARIKNVVDGGPADAAGIRVGDVVVKVGDRQVRSAAELVVAVRQHEIGEVVPVKVVRGGRTFTVDVKLGSDGD